MSIETTKAALKEARASLRETKRQAKQTLAQADHSLQLMSELIDIQKAVLRHTDIVLQQNIITAGIIQSYLEGGV